VSFDHVLSKLSCFESEQQLWFYHNKVQSHKALPVNQLKHFYCFLLFTYLSLVASTLYGYSNFQKFDMVCYLEYCKEKICL